MRKFSKTCDWLQHYACIMEFHKAQYWAHCLYTVDISLVIAQHVLQLHRHANDCRLYRYMSMLRQRQFPGCPLALPRSCTGWMLASYVWTSQRQSLTGENRQTRSSYSRVIHHTCEHSAGPRSNSIDNHLTMSAHVISVCHSAYCFLCQQRLFMRSLSVDPPKAVVHMLISLHLDNCSCLLYASPMSYSSS